MRAFLLDENVFKFPDFYLLRASAEGIMTSH